MEIWKDIEEYIGLYQVSNYGRVKSLEKYDALGHLRKEKMIIPSKCGAGHLHITIYKNGKREYYLIHQLVANAFIPNPENKPIVHHKDHNPENNNVDNLVWLTYEEHAAEHPEWGKPTALKCSKPINQYDLEGNFIRRWASAHDIEREFGYANGNINKCCNGKRRTAYGSIWQYAD